MFKVLKGSVEIVRGDGSFSLEANNDLVIIKKSSSYRIHNKSASEAILLVKRDD